MSEIISTDQYFPEQQYRYLAVLLGQMIPANEEMPGAADKLIMPSIVHRLEAESDLVTVALENFASLLAEHSVNNFDELTMPAQSDLLDTFRTGNGEFIQLLQSAAVMEYYRDDRVMLALGLEPRSPHPGGYHIPESNWTLLEPVKNMPNRYREV